MNSRLARACTSVLLVALLSIGSPAVASDVKPSDLDPPGQQQALQPQGRTSPNISFIDSPSAVCYQTNPGLNECFVNWQYLNVTSTAPAYMSQMTVTIGSRVRAVYQGFFTRQLYVSGDSHGRGFKVPCGALGAGGNPLLGLTHSYTIVAVDTSGLKSSNYGSVTCPGVRQVYLPLVLRI